MSALKCWTAPGVVFDSREALHEHYRSEWHQYNLKRKVANLPAVPLAMFEKLQLIAAEREAARNTVVKGTDHIKAAKRVGELPEASAASAPAPAPPSGTAAVAVGGATSTATSTATATAGAARGAAVELEPDEPDALAEPRESEPDPYEVDEVELKKPVDPLRCFVSGHVSATFEDNLIHMQKQFGFLVPDAQHCVDLPGLFKYCAQKVRAGRLCLFCDRPFRTKEGCLQHIKVKAHCKIPWETEEHFQEFEEYYDYSALNEGMEEDEQGELRRKDAPVVEVMDSGELLLTNRATGEHKILGHRDLRTYYAQKFQGEEQRASVLANSQERLLLMYKKAGVDPNDPGVSSRALLARPAPNGGRPAWMTKKLAREQLTDQHTIKKMQMRDGLQINWQTKNKMRMKKSMQAGMGVHG